MSAGAFFVVRFGQLAYIADACGQREAGKSAVVHQVTYRATGVAFAVKMVSKVALVRLFIASFSLCCHACDDAANLQCVVRAPPSPPAIAMRTVHARSALASGEFTSRAAFVYAVRTSLSRTGCCCCCCQSLEHPNVIKLHDVFDEGDYIHLVRLHSFSPHTHPRLTLRFIHPSMSMNAPTLTAKLCFLLCVPQILDICRGGELLDRILRVGLFSERQTVSVVRFSSCCDGGVSTVADVVSPCPSRAFVELVCRSHKSCKRFGIATARESCIEI